MTSDPVDIPPSKKQTTGKAEGGPSSVGSSHSSHPSEVEMVPEVHQPYSRSPCLQGYLQEKLDKASPVLLTDVKHRYKIVLVQDKKSTVLTSKGKPIEVIPPDVTALSQPQMVAESKKCSATNCRMVGFWTKKKIAMNEMVIHLDKFHGDLLHLERC